MTTLSSAVEPENALEASSSGAVLRQQPGLALLALSKRRSFSGSCCSGRVALLRRQLSLSDPICGIVALRQAACLLVDLGLDPYTIDKAIQFGFGMLMGRFGRVTWPGKLAGAAPMYS